MKVVKQKSTGKIVYRESPDFEEGKGIINASSFKRINKKDLEEVEITQIEWDESQREYQEEAEREAKIQAEMRKIAVDSLIAKGEL